MYMSMNNVSMSTVMAVLAMITEHGYVAQVTDLHRYDDEPDLYSVDFDMHLTSRFGVYGHCTDWARMREVCATVYSMVKDDVLSRSYSYGAVSLSFYRDKDDSMIHHYTHYTADYSIGGNDGNVRFVQLR